MVNISTEKILEELVASLSELPGVQSIGISGSKSPLPRATEGDIDIFVYCEKIPEPQERDTALIRLGELISEKKIQVFEGGHWGCGDYTSINGVETWIMYFTLKETLNNIDGILMGDFPDKLDNYYYPIGRCAMFEKMTVLYEKSDFLKNIKNRIAVYPDDLSKILAEYHLEELKDVEDLERAVSRSDTLFYHFALDIALDHFLQALFAINKVYFPSRKRSIEFISGFMKRPDACSERLLEAVNLGGDAVTIGKSYSLWKKLVSELGSL